ncbi:MAG: hypothetical protein E5X43_34745, partial [Mesorhizobium sp.]
MLKIWLIGQICFKSSCGCSPLGKSDGPCLSNGGQKGDSMTSDFAAAHLHLERACHYLRGDDETSSAARAALDI